MLKTLKYRWEQCMLLSYIPNFDLNGACFSWQPITMRMSLTLTVSDQYDYILLLSPSLNHDPDLMWLIWVICMEMICHFEYFISCLWNGKSLLKSQCCENYLEGWNKNNDSARVRTHLIHKIVCVCECVCAEEGVGEGKKINVSRYSNNLI